MHFVNKNDCLDNLFMVKKTPNFKEGRAFHCSSRKKMHSIFDQGLV